MWSLGLLLALASSKGDPSDPNLVEALRLGDREAFRTLFEHYHPQLYRFLVRFGIDDNAAEDVLQDVFAGLWTGRARLDPTRSIRAYLYRAVRNRAANHFRDRARFVDDSAAEPLSSAVAPDEEAYLQFLHARLDEAVSMLPERRRIVFELCFTNGLSYKEAADALGISLKTVENQMGYALKSIRQSIAKYLDAE